MRRYYLFGIALGATFLFLFMNSEIGAQSTYYRDTPSCKKLKARIYLYRERVNHWNRVTRSNSYILVQYKRKSGESGKEYLDRTYNSEYAKSVTGKKRYRHYWYDNSRKVAWVYISKEQLRQRLPENVRDEKLLMAKARSRQVKKEIMQGPLIETYNELKRLVTLYKKHCSVGAASAPMGVLGAEQENNNFGFGGTDSTGGHQTPKIRSVGKGVKREVRQGRSVKSQPGSAQSLDSLLGQKFKMKPRRGSSSD